MIPTFRSHRDQRLSERENFVLEQDRAKGRKEVSVWKWSRVNGKDRKVCHEEQEENDMRGVQKFSSCPTLTNTFNSKLFHVVSHFPPHNSHFLATCDLDPGYFSNLCLPDSTAYILHIRLHIELPPMSQLWLRIPFQPLASPGLICVKSQPLSEASPHTHSSYMLRRPQGFHDSVMQVSPFHPSPKPPTLAPTHVSLI